jgi:7-cyano-7-deazaguanine synthase in queuosine biosynthesis
LAEVFKDGFTRPSNLAIRISHTKLDRFGTTESNKDKEFVYSGVTRTDDYTCHATDNDNECGDCRMCWDTNAPLVIYPNH